MSPSRAANRQGSSMGCHHTRIRSLGLGLAVLLAGSACGSRLDEERLVSAWQARLPAPEVTTTPVDPGPESTTDTTAAGTTGTGAVTTGPGPARSPGPSASSRVASPRGGAPAVSASPGASQPAASTPVPGAASEAAP